MTPRDVYVSGNTVVVVGLNNNPRYRAGVGQFTPPFYYMADTTAAADQRLRDISGNLVSTPERVDDTNSTSELIRLDNVTELPSPESAIVDGNRLTLTFDAPMDGGSRPAAGAFTVKVNNSAVSLAGVNPVNVSGHEVTLILATAVTSGQNVTVSYTKPTSRPLQNVICEDAPSFPAMSVTNLTQ